ncbi:MAG TPA: pyridoxal-phosphate dependent enzyme [Ignavibacteria bacterium]|nr:pyridoxal-phosphate dependent enzyme [Ignavibacteria bacterium]
MKYYNNILELIGNTPLVKINKLAKESKGLVLAKLESMNPGGSVKDRIGINMIEAAEKDGTLKPGGTIVEATSGNTGIGIALAACVKGYKCIFVMTDKAAPEKKYYLQALGADVIVKPVSARADSPEHYVNTARRIHEETPNSIFIYQYFNTANPMSHYATTGPEIWEDTEGKITHFVAGIGTGGTISGTAKYLKEKNPNIKIIGADPYGSIFKGLKETGKIPDAVPYLVEGIGQDVLPGNVWLEYVDEVINVSDIDSINMCRVMSKEEGIFSGASSGTIAYAALEYAKKLKEDDVMVFIVCDTGERYLSKYHSDEWMREKRMLDTAFTDVGTVFKTRKLKDTPELVTISGTELVSDALYLMDQYNLSTLPVFENGQCIGSLNEATLLNKLVEDRYVASKRINEVMDEKLPTLDSHENIMKAVAELKEKPAVLVSEYGHIAGILTKYDVLDFV